MKIDMEDIKIWCGDCCGFVHVKAYDNKTLVNCILCDQTIALYTVKGKETKDEND